MNKKKIDALLGKYLLVGLTYLDKDNNLIKREQVHGTILRINKQEGIVIECPSGSEFKLPPDLSALSKAQSGDYRLKSTGEIVVNPDYLCTYNLHSSE